jgi:hypothetical protein
MHKPTGRIIVIAATLGMTLAAQDSQKPPARVSVRIVQVKMDMVNDFMDTIKTEVIPMWKKAGIPWASVSQPVFGPMGEFAIVTPVNQFADFGNNLIMKTLGPEQGLRLTGKLTRYTEKGTLLVATALPELSISHEGAPMPFTVITHCDVAPGRTAEFENWVKNDLLPALRKAEVLNFEVYASTFGAEVNHFVMIMPVKDLAEIDKGSPLMRSLGQEGVQALLAKTAGVVTRVSRYIDRNIPELSYGPEQRAAATGQ